MTKNKLALVPYFFTLAFATVSIQALILGFDTAGMRGAFVAAAIAYGTLGMVVGAIWSPNLLITSVLASIPTWLFMFALHDWSIIETVTRTVEGIPVVLEPLSVSFFLFVGCRIGNKLFTLRERFAQS